MKMSRAKERSTVYVVADSPEQAAEDLRREWAAERRPAWVIDTGTPATDPTAVEADVHVARRMREAMRISRLRAERDAIEAVVPPDPSAAIRAAELRQRRMQRERRDLEVGEGRYRGTPVGQAVSELRLANVNIERLERNLALGASRKDRRGWRAELERWLLKQHAAEHEVTELAAPERSRLDEAEEKLGETLSSVHEQADARQAWEHGGIMRLERLTAAIRLGGPGNTAERTPNLERTAGRVPQQLDTGVDLSL